MLDAVIDYLPSPVDIPPVKGILTTKRKVHANRKIASHLRTRIQDMTDPFVGQLTFIRVYSGS